MSVCLSVCTCRTLLAARCITRSCLLTGKGKEGVCVIRRVAAVPPSVFLTIGLRAVAIDVCTLASRLGNVCRERYLANAPPFP